MIGYFNFLSEREGASDSDVFALETAFGVPKEQAESIYRHWLDTLVKEVK